MRTLRFLPVVTAAVAGIVILGSGCAKTETPPGADSTLNRSNADVPGNPMNNAVGQTDDNNVRTAATDSAVRGADSTRKGTRPKPGDSTRRP